MNRFILFFFICISYLSYSQNINVETIGKAKPLKISGSVSANGVFYESNEQTNREPFTYFLRGRLNVSIYGFGMPISYSFTNQGENLDYALPFNFNRLSLHPTYKWVAAHIGDVAMTFSPYTLNGHQFTGGGVDLTPPGVFKISAMGGRLLKATPDDEDARTVPAFDRMGYGLKAAVEKKKFTIEIIGFYAKDNLTSIDSIPEAKGVLPKENLVLSLNGEVKLNKEFTLAVEYATTAITQDIRAADSDDNREGITGLIFNNKLSTEFYNALRTDLKYTVGRTSVGVGYERIDPGYETLGAYFFNNDFENITLNAANSFFNDTFTMSMNLGYQRDDLQNTKANATNRFIGAINLAYTASEKLSFTAEYSNFQTFTNVKPNQFDIINDDNLLDNEIENLDFKQLSQNANLGINYILTQKENQQQNLAFNYSLNDVANEQGGIVRIGDASTFHNIGVNHTITLPKKDWDVNTGINATYNTIGTEDAFTWGPSFSIGKRFLDKTFTTRAGVSYNESQNITSTTRVTNGRLNLTYVLKEKHNFSLSAIQLFRSVTTNSTNVSELTATFGYNYAFGVKKPKLQRKEKKKRTSISNDSIRIHYKKYNYEGVPKEITPQLIALPEQQEFSILIKDQQQLKELEKQLVETQEKDKRVYKEIAITYLKSLEVYTDFSSFYNDKLYQAYLQLLSEANAIDRQLRYELNVISGKLNSTAEKATEDLERQAILIKRYDAHTQLLTSLEEWGITPETIANSQDQFKTLKKRHAKKVFEMYTNEVAESKIIKYLEIRLADIFHKVLKD